jgi:hypothetical protein
MTVEELLDELKQMPMTARVETDLGAVVSVMYALGIVSMELEGVDEGDEDE